MKSEPVQRRRATTDNPQVKERQACQQPPQAAPRATSQRGPDRARAHSAEVKSLCTVASQNCGALQLSPTAQQVRKQLLVLRAARAPRGAVHLSISDTSGY